MPKLSRWFLKTSLIYLMLGMLLGGMILIEKAGIGEAHHWETLPIHIEWLFFGWILQMVLGVSYWIMPRFLTPGGATSRDATSRGATSKRTLVRGRGWTLFLAGLSYVCLNAGLILLTLVQIIQILSARGVVCPALGKILPPFVFLGPVLIGVGVLSYLVHLWPRLMNFASFFFSKD